MKFFSVQALLAAALFSVVVALPFLPQGQNEAGPFFFEAQVTSTNSGAAQIYFDTDGGFNEAASSRTVIAKTDRSQLCRLGLPAGTYRALRFDPLDRSGSMTIAKARIVSAGGRVLTEFPPAAFSAANQIAALTVDGATLKVALAVNADDPSLFVALSAPIVATPTLWDRIATLPRGALVCFAVLAIGLIVLDRKPTWCSAIVDRGASLAARPVRAIAIVAAVAVTISAYPVVFLGKSFVSPNLGTILLYDAYPTLPGYDDHEVADVQLSDVGAIMWQHVPFSMVQHRALAHGELPLWNRNTSTGTPLLGQGQSMFGDPLHFLVIAANGKAWAWDLKYLIAKWLFAFGLGLVVLELLAHRHLSPLEAKSTSFSPVQATSAPVGDGRHLASALVVTFASAFIGFFLYRLNHPAFFSLCYAPWPLFCWVKIVRTGHRRGFVWWSTGLIVANLALLTSGTAKEAYMLLLTMNLAGLAALLADNAPWRARLAKLLGLAWAGVIFALITAPLWGTFLHTLKNAYTSYNEASAFQLQPSLLLGLFDEIFFRPLMPNDRLLDPSLNFVLLLGLLYFVATLRSHFANRAAIAIAATSLIPLSFAFGLVPPQWIVNWPILANVAHLDNTFGCALIVLWAVLAGIGFATAARRLRTIEGRGDLAVVSLMLFALVFGWIAFRQAVHRPVLGPTTFSVHKPGAALAVSPFIWQYLWALLIATTVAGVVLRRSFVRGQLSATGGILLALCAVVLLWRHALHAPAVGFRGYIQQPTGRVNLQAKSPAIEFMRAAHRQEPARGFGLHGNFFPGWTATYGLEAVHGPDAIMSPFTRELQLASGLERMWDWRLYVSPEDTGKAKAFLDTLNVRWYFDLLSDQGILGRALKLAKVADLDVYESPTAWPRAFFTDRVLRYSKAAEYVGQINAGDGRAFAAVQTGDANAESAVATFSPELASRRIEPAHNYRLTENTTSFDVRAAAPGVVVLSESWWPDDFRAELNGKRVPILRMNHAFKGIVIPAAGDYHVRFDYWPHHFLRLLESSLVGLLLLIISLWLALRRQV